MLLDNPPIHYRCFRNGDPPQLAALWNRLLPDVGVVRPLSAHEFDSLALGRVDFDRRGLIVAELDGQIVGFAHAGFGPDQPEGPSHRLDLLLGTVAMLVLDPVYLDQGVGRELLDRAERYLKGRGAQVIYAGGQSPLDPYYRAIYGGSEWSGILDSHHDFHRVVEEAGYNVVSQAIMLDLNLADDEVRDPKAAILRRQTRFEVVEDAIPAQWWDAVALGPGMLNRYRLVGKADNRAVAHATTWDMASFGRIDGKARVGLVGVSVAPDQRRKGLGRHLVHEVVRHVRGQWVDLVSVTTDQTNTPALRLYESVGFHDIGSARLYRKPGS